MLISAALVAGAASGAKETASQALKDGYAGLEEAAEREVRRQPQSAGDAR